MWYIITVNVSIIICVSSRYIHFIDRSLTTNGILWNNLTLSGHVAGVVCHISKVIIKVDEVDILKDVYGIRIKGVNVSIGDKTIFSTGEIFIHWNNVEHTLHQSSRVKFDPITVNMNFSDMYQLYLVKRLLLSEELRVPIQVLLKMLPDGPSYKYNLAPLKVIGHISGLFGINMAKCIEKTINCIMKRFKNTFN